MSAAAEPRRHLWTADEYLRAWEAGVLPPGLRTELVDGEIIERSAQGAGHIRTVMQANELLRAAFQGVGHVRVQTTLHLGPRTMPEPDLLVMRGSVRDSAISP